MHSRARRTFLGEWWWTIDRLLLWAVVVLVLIGLVLMLAASPPVAIRLGADPFHFVNRHALYLVPALAVLLMTSFMTPRQARRVALVVFVIGVALTFATLFIGPEIKGARRWLSIFGVSVQPSEFMKPAFVVLAAWAFAESGKRPEMPATLTALGLLAVATVPLVYQPDIGQTALLILVWGALFFLSGVRWTWLVGHRLRRGVRAVCRLSVRPACHRAHPTIPRSGLGRHLPDRHGAGVVRARRLARPRAGRGDCQAHPAGRPRGFRVRGGRRGVRHRALPYSRRALRFHRAARARACDARGRCVRTVRGGGIGTSCSACRRRSPWP